MPKTPAIPPRVVKMDDGREVEFSGKKRLVKTTSTEGGKAAVRLDFENGETRLFTVPESLQLKFAAHGASQKLGDEISDVTDIEDAIETIDQLMQRLDQGEWSATTEPGSGLAGASTLARALVEVTGQSIAVVREYLGKLDNKVKLELRRDPTVAPVIKRLEDEKAERAAKRGSTAPKVDTAALLASLGAAPV